MHTELANRTSAVVYSAAHRRGGVERVVHELLAAGTGTRIPVFVGGELQPSLEGVAHRAVDERWGPPPIGLCRNRAAFRSALQDLRPDVAITAGANCPPGDVLVVGSVHRAWLSMAHPVTVRGRQLTGRLRLAHPWHRTMMELERRYFTDSRYSRAIACSDGVKSELVDHYSVDPDRISVVPNGYSAAEFSLQRRYELRDRVRAELVTSPDEIVLLLVANELHRKGLPTILRAMAALREPQLRLVVVGKASREPFEPLVAELKLERQVTWRGPTSTVNEYFAAADVLLLPARYEPFGLVVVEALATGLPVIVSRTAGAAGAVIEDVNGLLLDDPDSPDELASAISRALVPGVLPRWAHESAGSVGEYEWSRITPKIWAIADEVAATGNGRFSR